MLGGVDSKDSALSLPGFFVSPAPNDIRRTTARVATPLVLFDLLDQAACPDAAVFKNAWCQQKGL